MKQSLQDWVTDVKQMIISHKHEFIFIHTRKTAGSAIKCSLAKYLGPDDIVVGSINEYFEKNLPVPLNIQNFLESFLIRNLTDILCASGFDRGKVKNNLNPFVNLV